MYHRTGGFTSHERKRMSKSFSLLKTLLGFFKIPVEGMCVYTSEWPISSLFRGCDLHPNIYPPPQEEPSVIRDALFHERTEPKFRKIKGVNVAIDPSAKRECAPRNERRLSSKNVETAILVKTSKVSADAKIILTHAYVICFIASPMGSPSILPTTLLIK
ncbi:hypothetical protein Tco_0256403 [Tanacetum coccineum]